MVNYLAWPKFISYLHSDLVVRSISLQGLFGISRYSSGIEGDIVPPLRSCDRSTLHQEILKINFKESFKYWIIVGGSRGRAPTEPYSFVFAYIFTEKCPRRRCTPPKGSTPPAGNPGSATDYAVDYLKKFWFDVVPDIRLCYEISL